MMKNPTTTFNTMLSISTTRYRLTAFMLRAYV